MLTNTTTSMKGRKKGFEFGDTKIVFSHPIMIEQ